MFYLMFIDMFICLSIYQSFLHVFKVSQSSSTMFQGWSIEKNTSEMMVCDF